MSTEPVYTWEVDWDSEELSNFRGHWDDLYNIGYAGTRGAVNAVRAWLDATDNVNEADHVGCPVLYRVCHRSRFKFRLVSRPIYKMTRIDLLRASERHNRLPRCVLRRLGLYCGLPPAGEAAPGFRAPAVDAVPGPHAGPPDRFWGVVTLAQYTRGTSDVSSTSLQRIRHKGIFSY